jgi:hypothetical protein
MNQQPNDSTMTRILRADKARLVELAAKDQRTQVQVLSLALDALEAKRGRKSKYALEASPEMLAATKLAAKDVEDILAGREPEGPPPPPPYHVEGL